MQTFVGFFGFNVAVGLACGLLVVAPLMAGRTLFRSVNRDRRWIAPRRPNVSTPQ